MKGNCWGCFNQCNISFSISLELTCFISKLNEEKNLLFKINYGKFWSFQSEQRNSGMLLSSAFMGKFANLSDTRWDYDFNDDTDKALYDISLIYQYLYLCMANLDDFYRFLGGIIYSRNYIQWLCKLCPKSPSYTGILWSWLCFFQGTCNLALKKIIKKWKNNSIQVIFCYLQILIVNFE